MNFNTLKVSSLTLLIALLLGACGGSKSEDKKSSAQAPEMPTPPAIMTAPTERAGYMLGGLFEGVEEITPDMFANDRAREEWLSDLYAIGSNADEEVQRRTMDTFFNLATPAMDSIALEIGANYLGHPNSPIFNEERYLLVMEEANKQGLLDTADQVRLEDRKALFNRNKVGFPAEDFTYQTADGSKHTLYNSFKGYELLLMFYNPDCGTCQKFMEYIGTSNIIKSAVKKGLKVLCIYAQDDVEEWLSKLSIVPDFATAGYNADGVIWNESLYDLKALPTLYLLDKEKKVILKDTFPQDIENYLENR